MKKGILCSIVALALGLVLSLPTPVMASEIKLAKNTDPLTPNKYHVGDTIHYVLTVANPSTNSATNYLDVVEDFLPDGSTVTLDTNVTQAPGDSATYDLYYTVNEADLHFVGGHWKVFNILHVKGTDSLWDIIDATTSKSSIILRPELSIEKTVDFDNDTVFTDSETYYAGEPADWRIIVTNTGYEPVLNIFVSDDNMGVNFYGPFNLNPGEFESIPVYTTYPTADTLNTACAQGVDELGTTVGPVCDPAQVFVIGPDTTTTIAASATMVNPGDSVSLTITEKNTGGDPLDSPYVEVWEGPTTPTTYITTLYKNDSYWVGGDTNGDGVLDPTETWSWTNIDSGPITATTKLWALGFGTDSHGQEVSFNTGYLGERDNVQVTVLPHPPVGWETYPVNKLAVLAPWIALTAVIISGASLLVLRRRRT